MNVFVTGATGFCRFSRCSGANQIRPSGARTGGRWRPCDLEDLESLRSGEEEFHVVFAGPYQLQAS